MCVRIHIIMINLFDSASFKWTCMAICQGFVNIIVYIIVCITTYITIQNFVFYNVTKEFQIKKHFK